MTNVYMNHKMAYVHALVIKRIRHRQVQEEFRLPIGVHGAKNNSRSQEENNLMNQYVSR